MSRPPAAASGEPTRRSTRIRRRSGRYISGSFGTNAIGSLLLDPTDPTGNTLYAATGEENASGDSEAGVGIYKTTDGGDSWSLVPGSDRFFQRLIGRMALDSAGNLLVPIGSGVRGVSSVSGGALSSGATGHPLPTRGLWRQTGSTFTLLRGTFLRGSTTVAVDPTHAGIIYVNAFQEGIWRSTDNGATFLQIFAPKDNTAATANSATDRSEFAVTTLPSGATRMYVGEGQGGATGHLSNFWRSDDVDTAATFTSLGGAQVQDYCTTQCWYDNVVYTPAGHPDIVYLLGSFSYGQLGGVSNGRAVLLSSDGGSSWSDLTQDGDPSHAEFTHPDQHAIVTLPGNPYLYWEGSDGGIVSSDGTFANVAAKCDTRGLNAAGTALCESLLSRVPNQLANNINRGFSTLQFQSLSVSPQHPNSIIQGGTQDNGTWQNGGNHAANASWNQIMYGDGGQSGFSVTNDALRFNTFTGQANDANFQNGDPTKWVIISAPIFTSPEGAFFYPPVVADPHAANAGTIFQGSFSVWRTQDWGGNQAFLEANCPEFTTSAAKAGCGDFVPIGPAGATDLTDTFAIHYGADRRGSAVAWIQRTPSNAGTAWVATGAGRVFISNNTNAAASAVAFSRIDQTAANSPTRYISSIAVDPADPQHHGWVSVLGLQREHAGDAGPRVRGDLERHGRDLGGPQLQPAGLPNHRGYSRRSDGRSLCLVRLRRDEARARGDDVGGGGRRSAERRSGGPHDLAACALRGDARSQRVDSPIAVVSVGGAACAAPPLVRGRRSAEFSPKHRHRLAEEPSHDRPRA